jgi:hypothetical protein
VAVVHGAPASFLVVNDGKGGREHLNLSRWGRARPDLAEVVAAQGGDMPPPRLDVHSAGRSPPGSARCTRAIRRPPARAVERRRWWSSA